MSWVLLALAVPTVVIGWPWRLRSLLVLPTSEPLLEQMLAYGAPVASVDLGSSHLWAMGASVLIATVGIGLGLLYYSPLERWRRLDPRRTAERFGGLYAFLVHKWYFDELYDAVLVRPTLRLARAIGEFDRVVIDGVVNGSARLTAAVSWLEGNFDRYVVDGLVNLTGAVVYTLGGWGQLLQTGRLRSYLMFLSAAVVVLFVGIVFWVRG
jgi:NADH:ubiquinone oxidoreductase subunit 5 (subunit L)/multisubunit Na+/H+ antiporter MnhA subunit